MPGIQERLGAIRYAETFVALAAIWLAVSTMISWIITYG